MYRCLLYFAIFWASVLLVFQSNTLIIRICWHVLLIIFMLTYEHGLNKVKKSCIKSSHYSLCHDHDVKASEIWMHGDWLYKMAYENGSHGEKTAKRFAPNNLTRWIITQYKGFIRKGIEKVRKSVRTSI